MKIKINGNDVLTSASDIAGLAEEQGVRRSGTAIALDGKVIPKGEWAATPLAEGSSVLIINAAFGG